MCASQAVASNLTSPLQQRTPVPGAFTLFFFFSTLPLSSLTTVADPTTLTTDIAPRVLDIILYLSS